MRTVRDFARLKGEGRKISMVTAYDSWSAHLVALSNVDAILVGDSVMMVLHGQQTTLGTSVAVMALHTRAVTSACPDKFVIADLPFLSFRKGIRTAMTAVGALVKSGAQAVKLEGVDGHEDVIRHIVGSGVPVMGHLGLTPQSINRLGGYRVQGKEGKEAARLIHEAHRLEELGCFAIVLECMPSELAARMTSELQVPTIGIGAGRGTDGQVLVLHDLLGVGDGHTPRFVRRYLDGCRLLTDALNTYDADVEEARFPGPEETYR
jgi:3-methyl-2-oxobutanoate hydroxymethyltransferase